MNYLAPGFSYEKFIKAYGCTLSKGFFPYEWVTPLSKLDCESLPPKEAFHSELKNEDISDQNYAYCEHIWRDHDMKTFRDFLIWYNNRDVVPFLEAIEKQFHFYTNKGNNHSRALWVVAAGYVNISSSLLSAVTSPATISSPGMHAARGRVVKMEDGENAICFICWYYHLSWPCS